VYGLRDGLLKDLQVTMDRPDMVVQVFSDAIKRYPRQGGPTAPAADEADDEALD
jgi:carbonic anhydrase